MRYWHFKILSMDFLKTEDRTLETVDAYCKQLCSTYNKKKTCQTELFLTVRGISEFNDGFSSSLYIYS